VLTVPCVVSYSNFNYTSEWSGEPRKTFALHNSFYLLSLPDTPRDVYSFPCSLNAATNTMKHKKIHESSRENYLMSVSQCMCLTSNWCHTMILSYITPYTISICSFHAYELGWHSEWNGHFGGIVSYTLLRNQVKI
jgi:hypothetical protein